MRKNSNTAFHWKCNVQGQVKHVMIIYFLFFCNFFSWMEKMTSNIRWLGCIKDRLNWIILCSFPQQELEKQSKEVHCCLQRTFPAQEPRMECDSFSQTRVNVASGSFILFHSFYKKEKSHRGTEGPFTSQTHRLLPGNVIKKKQKNIYFLTFQLPPNILVQRVRVSMST